MGTAGLDREMQVTLPEHLALVSEQFKTWATIVQPCGLRFPVSRLSPSEPIALPLRLAAGETKSVSEGLVQSCA